ncbi:MAG: Ig-like domain-containing protein, partial [Candidatus Acidiferrum sp.]
MTGGITIGYSLGTIPVTLTGTGIVPLSISPSSRALGSVAIGQTSAAKTFTVTNHGAAPQPITISPVTGFGATDTCGEIVPGNGTCTIDATFTPTATGAVTGGITIGYSLGTLSVSLTGTGILPVAVSPTSIAFSTTLAVGTPSAAHTVTITNHQTVALTNLSITATPSSYAVTATTCGTSLAAAGDCTATVVFTPAVSGSIPGQLLVSDSAVGSPQMVSLTGAGALDNLVSIVVTVPDSTLPNGTTEQLQVTGTYRSGKTGNVTSSTTWSTTPSGVANISSTGVATGVGQGTTMVTGSVMGTTTVTGSASLVVGAPLLTSIAVSAQTNSLTYPGTLQFTATGTYSDGSTGDITSTATWASSNTAAATIAAGGMATAADPTTSTTTNITAALNGITSAPFGLTVVNAAPTLQTIVITGTQGSTTPATASIANGTSVQLYATGVYSNNSTQDLTTQVSWSSTSDATVSNTSGSQGLVTASTVGSATVTATLGAVNGNTLVSITPAVLASIAINPTTVTSWPQGTTQQFTAAGTFTDGSTQNVTTTVTWSVSSTAATIVASGATGGLATGVSQGPVIISASAPGVATASTQTLTVGAAALVSVTISPANASIALGTNETFTATGNYTDGTTQNLTSTVTWSAAPDPTGAATFPVNSSIATATAEGVVTITATPTSGPAGTTTMTITAPVLMSIAVTPATAKIYQGGTQQFTATGTFSDNSTQDLTSTVSWGTSNGAVATISTTGATAGLTSGVGGGGPIGISATYGSIVSTTTGGDGALTVVGITSIAVTPATPTVYLGDATPTNPYGLTNNTTQFIATVNYADNSNAVVTTSANWSSATTTVATISNTTGTQGLATVLTAGTSTIMATYAGASGTTVLTVSPALLESIAVTPASVSLGLLGTQQFAATGTYSDGSTQDVTSSVTWTSATPTLVSITSPGGLAQALGYNAGISITASETNAAGTLITSPAATVLVPPPTLLSITVGPPTISLAAGYTQQYTATGNYSDGSTQNLTTTVTWASSNTAFATITAGGLASSLTIGTTTISATSGTVVGTTTLTVTAPVLVSIAVSPAGVSLGLNGTQQFTATGTYSDGSTQNLTNTATWATQNAQVVTMGTTGLATVVAATNVAVAVTASSGTIAPYGAANTAWVSALSTLPIVCQGPTIDMRLLVVNNAEANAGAGYADFPAIQQVLNYVGTPYDVVDVSGAAPTLSDGGCHAYYQGVIFAYGGDYYSIPGWQSTLISYEQTFGVRQLNWYDTPDPNFGLSYTGTQIPSTQSYTTNFTTAAAPVFFYANTTTPLTITNAAVDLASADPAAGGTLTPLLQDASGNIVSAIYTLNGQQFLSQT